MSDFHRTLNDISKHIDSNNMKYMCQGVVMPAEMEEIKCPLNLLRELEECSKIYDGNIQSTSDRKNLIWLTSLSSVSVLGD